MAIENMKVEMITPDCLIQLNKPGSCYCVGIPECVKLSEVKIHVKAFPYKRLDYKCSASSRLYLFDSIKIQDKRGVNIVTHDLPEILELDDDYSIKISDILQDDMVSNYGLEIYLKRNDRPFEITELYILYSKNTCEEKQNKRFYKYFTLQHNILDNLGQQYHIYMIDSPWMKTPSEFKFHLLAKENGICHKSNHNYINDIEWIIIDNKEKITEHIKPLEKYNGHDIMVHIKPTSNIVFLLETKYYRD